MKKTIAIDFDGVIHGYSKGWQDGSIYDDPKPLARESLRELRALGFEVLIYSTRNHDRTVNGVRQKNQVEEVEAYLHKHGIEYDRIHTDCGKPFCMLFVDDNAVRFENDWESALRSILQIAK